MATLQISINESGDALAAWESREDHRAVIRSSLFSVSGMSWGADQVLSASDLNSFSPSLTFVGDEIVAVWQTFTTDSVFRIAGRLYTMGAWGPVSWISPTSSGHDTAPKVQIDDNGDGIAVWQHRNTNGLWQVYTSSFSSMTHTWSSGAALSEPSRLLLSPQFAAANGTGVAVWQQFNGSSFQIQAASLPFGAAAGEVVPLSTSTLNANVPQLSISSSGNALAVWHEADETSLIIRAVPLPSDGVWGGLLTYELSSADTSSLRPQSATNDSSFSVICWQALDSGRQKVQAVEFSVSDGWGSVFDLAQNLNQVANVHVCLNDSGEAVVVWEAFGSGGKQTIYASNRSSGGSWSSPETVSDTSEESTFPQVAIDGMGRAFALWRSNNGGIKTVKASRFSGGDWATPVIIGPN